MVAKRGRNYLRELGVMCCLLERGEKREVDGGVSPVWG
jgi:hypothetical protein